ncbi:hypothetical protein BN1723_017641, partial [Verticillium longisporum]
MSLTLRDKASKRQSTDTFDEPLPASEPAPADDLSRDIVPESISEPVAEQEDLSKLSKKERKKREKALAKEVVIVQDDVPSPAPETDLPATQPADVAAEDEWAAPSSSSKKKKKKGKKSTDTPDETEDQRVAVPVDAFQDLQSTTTGWGVVAAAVAGSVAASSDDKPSRNGEDRGRGWDDSSRSRTYEAVDARPSWDDTDAPSIPGPKPRSPSPSGRNPTMPGGFGDDAEFTSIMAAGLQDSGFDPKIVTQNPAYSRKSWDDSSKPRSDVGTKGQSSWDDKDASWVSETKKTRSSSAGPRRARPSGGYGDDVEFASVLAAGLQDTGFDPNIVIDDPTYRRRDSPPGSNEPGLYHRPYAETVSDLGLMADAIPRGPLPESGIVLGELTETPVQETAPAVDGWDTPSKLSKKDKKKRDKASKRQSTDTFDEPLPASEPAPADDLSRD